MRSYCLSNAAVERWLISIQHQFCSTKKERWGKKGRGKEREREKIPSESQEKIKEQQKALKKKKATAAAAPAPISFWTWTLFLMDHPATLKLAGDAFDK